MESCEERTAQARIEVLDSSRSSSPSRPVACSISWLTRTRRSIGASAYSSLPDDYAYLVPFVEEEDHYFKTVIPSRKATRDFLSKGKADV
jgi:hypothetical protein